jgi:RNA polymerase-binding protein DksA
MLRKIKLSVHVAPRISIGSRTDCSDEEQFVALTKTQLAKLERKLDEQYQALLEEVRDALENSENLQYVELIDRAPADTADQATADALADLNLAIIDRHVHEIRDIDATRARIAGGGFGTCIDCGTDIGYERLLAYPRARRCFVCQRQHEKTYAHEGNPTL